LEIANFEKFLDLGKNHFDRYEAQKPPEPDIIAWRAENAFGIEVTNFYRQLENQKESEEDRTLESALTLYRLHKGPNIYLSIMWAPHFTMRERDRKEIAAKIAALALTHAPAPNHWLTLDWHQFDRGLMTVVDHISLYGLPEDSQTDWHAGRGRFVPEWTVSEMQKQLDRKKGKPTRYRRHYVEIWLLLVSAFGMPSSWMEINENVRDAYFTSPFDKVFVLSSFPHEVVLLKSSKVRTT
jgi:hypothetical protein